MPDRRLIAAGGEIEATDIFFENHMRSAGWPDMGFCRVAKCRIWSFCVLDLETGPSRRSPFEKRATWGLFTMGGITQP